MKFGMPSRKVLKYGLHFLIFSAIIVGMLALFMGVITINVNVGGGLDSGPTYANIIGNGSYFKYLEVQKKFNKLYAKLNSISPNTTIDYHYSPLSRTTNHIDDEIHMKSGILPTHNAAGILPTPALGPGPVMPSGSLAAHNA
jgi:hypothetical protein